MNRPSSAVSTHTGPNESALDGTRELDNGFVQRPAARIIDDATFDARGGGSRPGLLTLSREDAHRSGQKAGGDRDSRHGLEILLHAVAGGCAGAELCPDRVR